MFLGVLQYWTKYFMQIPELSKTDFFVKYFRRNFLEFSSAIVNIFILSGQNSKHFEISLKSHLVTREATRKLVLWR